MSGPVFSEPIWPSVASLAEIQGMSLEDREKFARDAVAQLCADMDVIFDAVDTLRQRNMLRPHVIKRDQEKEGLLHERLAQIHLSIETALTPLMLSNFKGGVEFIATIWGADVTEKAWNKWLSDQLK